MGADVDDARRKLRQVLCRRGMGLQQFRDWVLTNVIEDGDWEDVRTVDECLALLGEERLVL